MRKSKVEKTTVNTAPATTAKAVTLKEARFLRTLVNRRTSYIGYAFSAAERALSIATADLTDESFHCCRLGIAGHVPLRDAMHLRPVESFESIAAADDAHRQSAKEGLQQIRRSLEIIKNSHYSGGGSTAIGLSIVAEDITSFVHKTLGHGRATSMRLLETSASIEALASLVENTRMDRERLEEYDNSRKPRLRKVVG